MAKLSSLIVDIQANTASLKSGLEQANGYLSKFSQQASKAANAVAGLFVLDKVKDAGMQLAGFVKHGAEVADQMGKMAQSAGVPVEAMSKLAYAASFSEISTEELGASMTKLSKNMKEATLGGNDQAAVFKALGISVKDSSGHLKTVDVMMAELSNKFAGMQDGTAKSALAMEVFGKSGANMIPLLNGGAEGLKRLGEEAAASGNVITEQAAASAEVFNDSLTRMEKSSEGLAIQLAAQLTPAMGAISTSFSDGVTTAGALQTAVKALAFVFKVVVEVASDVALTLKFIAMSVIALFQAQGHAMKGEFDKAGEDMRRLGLHIKWASEDAAEFSKKLWADTNPIADMGKREEGAAKKSADGILNTYNGLKKKKEQDAEAEKRRQKAFEASKYFMENTDINSLVLKAPKHNFGSRMSDGGGVSNSNRGNTGQLSTGGSGSWGAIFDAQQRLANASANAAKMISIELLPAFGGLSDAIAAVGGPVATAATDVLGSAGVGASAGPMGAIIGVLVSLLGKSEGFQGVIEMVGAIVGKVSDGLGTVLVPLQRLLASLMPLADAVGQWIAPIGNVVNTVVNMLIPPLTVLGLLFQAMAPAFGILVTTLSLSIIPIITGILPALEFLFESFRMLGIGVLYLTKGFAGFWNGALSFISGILKTLANMKIDIGVAVIAPFAVLGDLAKGMDTAQVNISGLNGQIDTLKNMTWEQAQAAADAAKAQVLNTQAVDKATASMTNVPSGWKAAMAVFNATKGQYKMPAFANGGVVNKATMALVGEGGERELIAPESMLRQVMREEGGGAGNVTIVIQGGRDSKEQLAKEVQRVLRRDNLRRGRPMLGGNPFGGT